MENEDKLKNKAVETYTEDMVKAIEGDKEGGLIKKIIHEEEEHETLKKNLSPKSRRNRIFMIVSVALVSLAVVVLAFLVFFNKKINVVPVAPQAMPVIFIDQTNFEAIDGLNRDQVEQSFFNQANSSKVKMGGVEGIYLTENQQVIGFKRFLNVIKGNFPSDQTDLVNESFLLGDFKNGLSSVSPYIGDPFILLKVRSFADIFPVMRIWENKMLYDLNGFFGVEITPNTNYLFTKNFEDDIVANKNARVLKDNNGKIILMYVFADDNSVIISNSESAVNEVILRLASGNIRK